MADLKFEVDYSQLSRAVDELTRMGKASKNTSTAFEQAFRLVKRWQDTFAGQQGKVNAELEKTALKLKLANKSAKESAQAFLAHEKAIEDNTNALKRMRMAYDSSYAAEQRTLQLKKLLRQEIDNGNMTVRQAGAELGKYKAQLRSFNTAQMAATKSANRFGVVTQQAGYQVSDFIVQVQSGTNPFIAFSQQGAQLAGVLPLIAGRLGLTTAAAVGLSAALGIVIPLVGAIGAAWLMSRKSQDAFNGALPTLKESLKSVGEEVSDLNLELAKLKGNFDSASEAALENALANLKAERAKLGPRTGQFKVLGDQIKEAEDALKALRERRGELDKLEKQEEAIKDFLKAQNEYLADQQAKRKANGQAMQEALDLQQEVHQKAMGNTFEQRQAQSESMKLLLDSIKVYKENEEQKKKDADQAKRDAEALAELTLKVSSTPVYKPMDSFSQAAEESRQKLIDIFEISNNLTKEIGQAAKQALIVGGVDIAKGVSEAAKQAGILAANLGISLNAAFQMQFLGSKKPGAVYSGPNRNIGRGSSNVINDSYMNQMGYKTVDEVIKELKDKANKGASKKDPLKDLQKQLELEKALVGQTEARQRVMQALGVEFVKNNPKVVAGLEEQINAINAAKEADEQRLAIQQTIEGALEDGFMSMIDGTKSVQEAFKDMARQVIAELYRILVVKKMVAAITSALPFADGGVFQGGSQVKAFANGGVVGGPTYFPMSGGRTGLMGEAGPEAIMPLKRGKDGKLGVAADGGGGVTINQTFAFQANGDDSVKKIIAQAAPKIAAMTQQQIMDSRRRGGQMKQVFG